MTFLPEAVQFPLELSHELIDEHLVAEENIPQSIQYALFQLVGTNPAICITGALLTACRTVVAVTSAKRHTAATASTFEQTREQAFLILPLVAPSRGIALLHVLDLLP
jgi:hypothetical protein